MPKVNDSLIIMSEKSKKVMKLPECQKSIDSQQSTEAGTSGRDKTVVGIHSNSCPLNSDHACVHSNSCPLNGDRTSRRARSSALFRVVKGI